MNRQLLLAFVTLHSLHLVGLAQWQNVLSNGSVYGVAVQGSSVFAAVTGSQFAGVYRSTDNGATWAKKDSGITAPLLWQLRSINGVLLAGTQTSSAFRSTNNGESWQNVGMTSVRGFALHRDTMFAVQWGPGAVLHSVDSGATWSSTPQAPSASGLWPIISKDEWLFVGGQAGGVFRSSNKGTTWTQVNNGLTNTIAYALARMGNYVFVGTGGSGVFRSTNNGDAWTSASYGMGNATVYGLHVHDTLLIAATSSQGVYVSRDSGATWYTVGLPTPLFGGLASDYSYVYAGSSQGVHRRPLSQILTSVQEVSREAPHEFGLEQNYPNPFNPSTIITFHIPDRKIQTRVMLKVYDVLGREVRTLVNESLPAGRYETTFDATGLPSGVYFYRLQAREFMQTKRMLLLK